MEAKVAELLTKYSQENKNEIVKILNDESAKYFLIIWSIFETQLFEGFIKSKDILEFSFIDDHDYDKMNIDDIVLHFYDRYQDLDNYQRLKHKDKCTEYDQFLKSKYDESENILKIQFLIYVIYRYRNNIFHGNKGINSWLNYKEQMDLCTEAMINILGVDGYYQIKIKG